MIERVGSGGVRVGRLLVVPAQQASGAPWVDSSSTTLTRVGNARGVALTGPDVEHYGGLTIRVPGGHVCVAWRDALAPHPHRWLLLHPRAWWRWQHRTIPAPSTQDGWGSSA